LKKADDRAPVQGVCVFGPTAPPVPITIFGEHGVHKVRELTRLVVNDSIKPNSLSFFVSSCLKMLPAMCLVSFADSANGHHGYIYQATNWVYTGEGGQPIQFVNRQGKKIHSLTVNDGAKRDKVTQKEYCLKHSITAKKGEPKYRYITASGNKRERKKILADVILPSLPYPKGDNKRYDTSYKATVQYELF
jgi:hypothetical protein